MRLVVGAAALSLVLTPTVAADTLRVPDLNDVPGRLDFKAVAHGHGARKGMVTHRISTRRAFATRLLRRNGSLELFFSGRPGGCISWHVVLDSTKRGLRARGRMIDPLGCGKFDDSGASGPFEPVDATLTRPNDRTVKIRLSRKLLPGRGDYGWYAESSFRKRGTKCARACHDEAPDEADARGRIAHEIRRRA